MAEQYLMEHIDVPEIRMIVVDKAIAEKNYQQVEKLCKEAIEKKMRTFHPACSLGLLFGTNLR